MLGDIRDCLIVLIAVAVLTFCMVYLRRTRPHGLDMNQRNLVATNFGFFTTLYTFFLGFAVVVLWQSYNGADDNITAETQAIMTEYRLSQALPETGALRQSLQAYAGHIASTGWERMRKGDVDDGAGDLLTDIWAKTLALKPAGETAQSVYRIMLTGLTDIEKGRTNRLNSVPGNLYAPIWIIIYLGIFFTIFGFYFVDSENKTADLFYIAMIVSLVLANIFILYELNTPFSGYIAIDPDKFQVLLTQMRAL